MEVIDLKKIILMVTFILLVIIGLYGTIKINEKGNPVSRYNDIDISAACLGDGDEIFETVKSNISALSYGGDSEKLGYLGDDLVYREYSWGHCLEKGYEITIEKESMLSEVKNIQTIVIVLDGDIYKEISFNNNDIEFTLEESGNYAFLAIDSDGNSVDMAPMVKVNVSADGGTILLN